MTGWPIRRHGRPPPRVGRIASCGTCGSFVDDPAAIEAALPGLSALSSGFGAVRGHDGLCLSHDRFVTAGSSCEAFRPRPEPEPQSPGRP